METLYTLQSLTDGLAEPGDQTAILALHQEGATHWSYTDLANHVQEMAYGLAKAGIGPGEHIALLAVNQPTWVVACLAILAAGAIVVPLDAQFDDATLRHVLEDSDTRYIFTSNDKVSRLQRLDLQVPPQTFLLDSDADDAQSWRRLLSDTPAELPRLDPDEPAVLFYTSGTTGPPKGVPLKHGNLVFQLNTLLDTRLVTHHDRILLSLPLHHVYPFVMGMLTPLRLGLALIMPQSLTGKQIVRALQEGQVTVMIGVPRLYRALFTAIAAQTTSRGHLTTALLKGIRHLSTTLRRHWELRLGKLLLRPLHQQFGPQLRLLASGGAALDSELAWQLEGLGWRIASGYGLTETAPLLTINRPGAAKIESAGRPIPGVELRIDPSAVPDALKEQAQHQAEASHPQGEILARGPSVFSGYHSLPEQTKEVFTADGWFRTGDFGTFDNDGYLYVLGRVSTLMVTTSGENIQPEDVEDAYLASSSIREIGVLQQDDQLVAVIVPELSKLRQHSEDIAQGIRTAVAEQSKHIPSYQRVTDYVITRHPLPRTHLGKIRRHLLPDLYAQTRKEDQTPHDHAAGPLALHEMAAEDQALLQAPAAKQVWSWLASHYADRPLSPDTSPQLDLGIDSLEWLNLTLAVSQHTGIEINEQMISRIETVRDLLREVAEHTEAGATPRHASPLEEPEAVLNDQQKRWLKPLGPVKTGMAWSLYILNRLVMRGLFRLRLQGCEHLANQDQMVLTPNHSSYLDPFAIAAALSFHRLRQMHWGGWTGVAFSNPLSRFVSRLAQAVPIDAEQAVISSLAFGAAVLKRKKSLVWFPEGHRSTNGELQPFQPGIGMLRHHFPVPVVPVHLHGSYAAMPPGAVLPRLRRITVVIGKPLNPCDLAQQGQGDAPHERLVHVLHHHVAELGRYPHATRN